MKTRFEILGTIISFLLISINVENVLAQQPSEVVITSQAVPSYDLKCGEDVRIEVETDSVTKMLICFTDNCPGDRSFIVVNDQELKQHIFHDHISDGETKCFLVTVPKKGFIRMFCRGRGDKPCKWSIQCCKE